MLSSPCNFSSKVNCYRWSSVADIQLTTSSILIATRTDRVKVVLIGSLAPAKTYVIKNHVPMQKLMEPYAIDLGYTVDQLGFYHGGNFIKPDKTPTDLGIKEKDTIHVALERMLIFVKPPTEPAYTFSIGPNQLMRVLMQKYRHLQSQKGITVPVKFSFRGKVIQEEDTISKLLIPNKTTLLAIPTPSPPTQEGASGILVKLVDQRSGNQLAVRASRKASLASLLDRFCENMNLPFSSMKVTYNENSIHNFSMTLDQLGVSEGEEIIVKTGKKEVAPAAIIRKATTFKSPTTT